MINQSLTFYILFLLLRIHGTSTERTIQQVNNHYKELDEVPILKELREQLAKTLMSCDHIHNDVHRWHHAELSSTHGCN